jgi:hypothetical protein
MEALRPFQYKTLWMSKRNIVTLHPVITVYNDMIDHMDGVMSALAKEKTQWREDLYFAVKVARQKLSKYYAEVTPMTGLLRISADILDPFRKLRSLWKWEKVIDIHPKDEMSYTTEYQEVILKFVANEYRTKHRRMSVIQPVKVQHRNISPSATASGYGELSFDA